MARRNLIISDITRAQIESLVASTDAANMSEVVRRAVGFYSQVMGFASDGWTIAAVDSDGDVHRLLIAEAS